MMPQKDILGERTFRATSLGAIGTWACLIATVIALWITLRPTTLSSPSVSIAVDHLDETHPYREHIFQAEHRFTMRVSAIRITNSGHQPVRNVITRIHAPEDHWLAYAAGYDDAMAIYGGQHRLRLNERGVRLVGKPSSIEVTIPRIGPNLTVTVGIGYSCETGVPRRDVSAFLMDYE